MNAETKKRLEAAAFAALASLAILALGAGAEKVSTKRDDRMAARKAEQQRWTAIVADVAPSSSTETSGTSTACKDSEAIIRLIAKPIR